MDFYAILGLDPSASAADIKRAYRRLARRYHPGINPGDRAAEAMYARVSEAYETLIDPLRRQRYDAEGGAAQPVEAASVQFTEFDFSVAAHGAQAATFSELFAEVLNPVPRPGAARPESGADIQTSVTVGFAEAFRGTERQVLVVRQVACSRCRGSGQMPVHEVRCAACQGTGRMRWARGHMVFVRACEACGGAGRRRVQRCAACGGHGRSLRSDAVRVAVPPGTADGVRLRVPGRGHVGQHGGPYGDLYVTVHVQPHPVFRREGDDLTCVLPVAVHEAVLGAEIEIPSLDGPVALEVPPGTQAGDRLRVPGRGMAGPAGTRGAFVAEVQLVLPARVDERSRELMRAFGERNRDDVRRAWVEQLSQAG